MTDHPPVHAWCFSHGRMHTFPSIHEAWCTADWIPLDGATEEAAHADKVTRYGEAIHHDHLPLEAQERLISEVEQREKRQASTV